MTSSRRTTRATLAFTIRSGVDAAVTLTAEAPEVALGEPLQIYADISSLRGLALRDAVLSLNLNQAVIAASLAGASCVPSARYSVVCTLAELPGGRIATAHRHDAIPSRLDPCTRRHSHRRR